MFETDSALCNDLINGAVDNISNIVTEAAKKEFESRHDFVNKIESIIKYQYMQFWHNDVPTSDKI